jgi:hypothetical protein
MGDPQYNAIVVGGGLAGTLASPSFPSFPSSSSPFPPSLILSILPYPSILPSLLNPIITVPTHH